MRTEEQIRADVKSLLKISEKDWNKKDNKVFLEWRVKDEYQLQQEVEEAIREELELDYKIEERKQYLERLKKK